MQFPACLQRGWISLTLLAMAGCTGLAPVTAPLVNYKPESFDASAYVRHYAARAARTCEAARRALLSQGYVVTTAEKDQVTARKYFQPGPEHHVQLEFRVVCAPEGPGGDASVAFVSGLKDQYLVRKAKESASLGVGGIGSLSLPIEGSMDSMVKVSSETVADHELYARFFQLVNDYLVRGVDTAAEVSVPPPAPGAGPAPAATPSPSAATVPVAVPVPLPAAAPVASPEPAALPALPASEAVAPQVPASGASPS